MIDYKSITWKYLSMLFILFSLIVAGRFYYDYKHHEWMLEEKTSELSKSIKKSFYAAQDNLVKTYMMLGSHLMKDDELPIFFEQRRRDKIHMLLKDDFKEFKLLDSNLQVMHFIDTDNLTVIRMHKPLSYDDDLTLKRPIVEYVNKTQKQQNGFEVGKNGIVYRVTIPFYNKSKHIGILEFGISPNYFVDTINKHSEVESQILVRNELLDILSVKKDFQKIGEYSVITQSDLFKNLSSAIDITQNRQVVQYNSSSYIIMTDLNLHDYQGKEVAKVIIAKDITEYVNSNNTSMLFVNTMTVIILILALLLLYIIFTKYVAEINSNIKTMSKLNKKSDYFERRANRDSLTKTYNKNYMNHHLKDLLKVGGEGVLLFFDIDHFKNCNDTHGHVVGDEVLIKISQTIREYLRDDDLFVRWGGEEFIILFEDISEDIAIQRAEEIRKLIEETEFINSIPVTISIGVTKIKKGDTINSLLKRADSLLYKAKESGRNRVVCDI